MEAEDGKAATNRVHGKRPSRKQRQAEVSVEERDKESNSRMDTAEAERGQAKMEPAGDLAQSGRKEERWSVKGAIAVGKQKKAQRTQETHTTDCNRNDDTG